MPSPDIPALVLDFEAKTSKLLHIQTFTTFLYTAIILSNLVGGGFGILIICLQIIYLLKKYLACGHPCQDNPFLP